MTMSLGKTRCMGNLLKNRNKTLLMSLNSGHADGDVPLVVNDNNKENEIDTK